MNDLPQPPSARTTVRKDARADYDRSTVDAILDEALVAHVGITGDEAPFVIPMLHARIGDRLHLHGGAASRLMRAMKAGTEICVTVTILDGLVLARSAFNHSVNYRSVVLFGRPTPVDDLEERRLVLDAYTDKLVPERRPHLRPMTDKEVRATTVVWVPIDEASAKVRAGGPVDEPEDMTLEMWAGVVPLSLIAGTPIPDETSTGLPTPAHVEALTR